MPHHLDEVADESHAEQHTEQVVCSLAGTERPDRSSGRQSLASKSHTCGSRIAKTKVSCRVCQWLQRLCFESVGADLDARDDQELCSLY